MKPGMKRGVALCAPLLLAVVGPALALNNGLALTPPMGFNSYMAGLGGGDGLMQIAKFFVSSGLVHSGYEYVNSDEGWEQKTRDNVTGKIVPGPSFGDMKKYADTIHDLGLKLGLYGAASGVTCGQEPGQLYFEDIDAETYASWGLDYLKSDNCASYALDSSVRFGAMRDALNRTGKGIVLSIEPFSVTPDPEQSVKVSNLWRVACDIQRSYSDVLNRAAISDKWAPLAGPGGWNDPDMINIRAADTLGESRTYFGLWAIMKAPLLLSSNLPELPPTAIAIVNNSGLIRVNQDPLGVQARKLWIDGEAVPWLVGLKACDAREERWYTRAFGDAAAADPRQWTVTPLGGPKNGNSARNSAGTTAATSEYTLTNTATGRCLTANGSAAAEANAVVLLPCNGTAAQRWTFGKGAHTVTSVTNVATGLALAVANETLYAAQVGADAFPVPSTAYGEPRLVLVPPYNQDACRSRDCQNYDPSQMWYYSPTEGLLRQATYTASINHKDVGNGYRLTEKVPTYAHHCLSHVLSTQNMPSPQGTTEVWGGPLGPAAGGSAVDFVVALLNTGESPATVTATWGMLGYPGVGAGSAFTVTELWTGKALGKQTGGMSAEVAPKDLAVYRLTPA